MSQRLVRIALVLLGLTVATATAEAQQRTIRGTVTDSLSGQRVANPNVQVEGTQIGVIGENDGTFVLRGAPAGEVTLIVRRIGYQTRRVTVPSGRNEVTVRLGTDFLQLEELVVTGRATEVRRENLATSVATLNSEEVNEVPAQSVENALSGKVPGAVFYNNSGAPGGGMQVNLRGGSSIFASTQPLYVIDGVIVSNDAIANGLNTVTQSAGGTSASSQDDAVNRIADLNPEDIESIEVLKGATAAAQYGSKASNGVIVITTKTGAAGETDVRLTQRFGFSDLSNKIGTRTWNSAQEVAANLGGDAADLFNAANGQTFDNEEFLAGRNDLNWETSASVSGGDEDLQFYGSGLWKNDEGIIENTGYEKQSGRLNLSKQLGDGWDVSVNTNLIRSEARRGLTNNDNSQTSYYMVLQGTPDFVDLRPDADGTFPENPFMGNGSNPLQSASLFENTEEVLRGTGSGQVAWEAFSNEQHSLRLNSTVGVDVFEQENTIFSPPAIFFEDADGLPGTKVLGNSDNINVNTNANAIWDFSPEGMNATFTTSTGVQFERTQLDISRVFAQSLTAGTPTVAAGNQTSLQDSTLITEDFGVYVQEDMLAFDERLFVSGGVRFDQSSSNGDPEEVFIFPSASASWRFPDLGSVLQEVKVRAAFGQSGNQPRFGQKSTTLDASNNIQGIPGVIVGLNAGSADIQPERTTEFEGGLDFTLLDGRARLEATAYRQVIDDLILQRTLAPSTGVQSQFFNGGELESEGLEFLLRATPVAGAVTWNTIGTFQTNSTTVSDLPEGVGAFFLPGGFGVGADPRIQEGRSLTQLVGPNGANPDGSTNFTKFGDSSPEYTISWTNNISWKGLRLHGLFDARQGFDVVNLTELLYDASFNSPDWEPPNPDELRPAAECQDDCSGAERLGIFLPSDGSAPVTGQGFLQGFHQGYVQDGSFIKLRELSLSWDLPATWVQAVPGAFDNLRVILTGRDLITITDYRGLDPEVSNFGNQPAGRNIDVAPFPPSRSFWFSVEARF